MTPQLARHMPVYAYEDDDADSPASPANTPRWTPCTAGSRGVMSFTPGGDSALIPASAISAQHTCGFWAAVSRRAARAR